jgi:hypothetical protein
MKIQKPTITDFTSATHDHSNAAGGGTIANITGNAATVTTNANLTGDATSVGNASTVIKINGTALSGLATGILKNTTGTGVPSIAVSRTDYGEPTTALATGILKNTTTTGAHTIAVNSDLPAMSATVGGAVPTPPNNTTTFLRGDGTFAAPAGSGTVTATAGSLTANAVVLGAGTTDTKVSTGITTDGVANITLGVNATTIGSVKMFGNTSGDATIRPTAVAGTATVQTLPATTGTLINRVTTANGVSASNSDGALTVSLGAITPTTVNGNTITTGSSTYTGTAGQTYTFPTTSATIARTDAANTFTGIQTMTSPDITTSMTTGSASFTALAGATTLLTIGGTGASASMFAPSTLDATSSITGAIRTSGGISAAKALNIGTTITGGSTINAVTGFKINGAATSRKMLVGDGTNFIASTETWAVPGTSGNVLTSDGTNWTSAAPYSVVSVTAATHNETATSGEKILLCDATSNAITVNLPTAVGNTSKFTIKKTNASVNAVTVDASSTQTIDGSLTVLLNYRYSSITIVSDNANWSIISFVENAFIL